MSRKVTIEDIARQSNASASTVSLVLRNRPGISTETRQRVLDAARALGYRRRAVGPEEQGKETLTVGMALRARNRTPDTSLPVVNPFYSWVLTGIETAARQHRINLLYATIPVDEGNRPIDLPHQLLDQSLDGLFLIGAFDDATVTEIAGTRPTPIVLVDNHAGPHDHDTVTSHNRVGSYDAVAHLIRQGHRHIALAALHREADPVFAERREGYLQVLREHGLPDFSIECGAMADASAVVRALDRHPEITAVFGCNDALAIATLRAAAQSGRRVPDDLSVVGFDDIELAMHTTPTLTTMAVDKVSMGRVAVQTLLFRLAWPDAAPMLTQLRPRLIERGSVAAR
jgi:LacI family transcriptional regulator